MNSMQKRIVRLMAGADRNTTVMEVDGSTQPQLIGRHGYWTTPSGKTVVHHPNAYGWRTVYHCSTLRVEVGIGWFAGDGRHYDIRKEDGVEAVYDLRTHVRCGEMSAVRERTGKHWLVARGDGDCRRTWHANGRMSAHEAMISAEDGWERQDREARTRELSVLRGEAAWAVPVTVGASVRAGNCEVGTLQFGRTHRLGRMASAELVMRAGKSSAISRAVAQAALECATTVMI